jgi:hypothetical protein
MVFDGWPFRRREAREPPISAPPPASRGNFLIDPDADGEPELDDTLAGTLAAIRAAGGQLPGVAWSRLRLIVDVLTPLITYVRDRGVSAEQAVLLHSVAGEYLRDPLNAYLGVARTERVPGSEADSLLNRQLEVLESATRDLDATIRSGSLAELDLHGRFLAERFMVSELEGNR